MFFRVLLLLIKEEKIVIHNIKNWLEYAIYCDLWYL